MLLAFFNVQIKISLSLSPSRPTRTLFPQKVLPFFWHSNMHTDEEGEKSLITSSSSVSQPSPPLSSSSSSSPGKSASAAKKLVIQEPDKNQPDPRQQQREERRGSLSSSTLSVNRHAFQAGRHAYHRRVSFDNSTNEAPSVHHSFVLRRSTQGFERTKRTRTFMIPVDLDGGSTDAVCKTMTVTMAAACFHWNILYKTCFLSLGFCRRRWYGGRCRSVQWE